MTSQVGKGYEKHAWILLLAAAIVLLVDGLLSLIESASPSIISEDLGVSWEQLVGSSPTIANFVLISLRAGGLSSFVMSVFVMSLSRKSYRKGERWAWYLLWLLPAFFVIYGLELVSAGFPPVSPLTVLGLPLSLLGLLLPYRKFFPKNQA